MHPILLQLGPLTLRSYGLMMALGFAMGIILTSLLTKREGRATEPVLDMAVWTMIGGIVGARILYVLVNPAEYAEHPAEIFKVWRGGLVYYGGLIGAGFATYYWLRKHKQPIWAVADCLAPGLAAGQVLGRVGCYLNGCCYGSVNQEHGVIFPEVADGLPHLPVQLYEAGFALLLAYALYQLKKHRSFAGQIFWLYVLAYGLGRFALEYFRGDFERGILISNALSPSQWISLAGVVWALAMLRYLSQKSKGRRS